MYSYTAYGLGIRSTLPLRTLPAGNGRSDVAVRSARAGRVLADLEQRGVDFVRTSAEIRILHEGIGAYSIRNGREILIDPLPTADPGAVENGLVGPAFAALLRQRGHLVLHGSAVRMGGAGVLFLGSAGSGKSTMIAALHDRGHPVVADDVSAIRFREGRPCLVPGTPQVKLWPDAAAALGHDPGSLPRIGVDYTKRRRTADRGFISEGLVPLARIYLLDEGEAPRIEPVPAGEAFLHLTIHSYGIRWFLAEVAAAQLEQRACVAREIPFFRLRRPESLELLSDVVTMVEGAVAADG